MPSGNLLTVVILCFDSYLYHTVLYLAFYLASIPVWHTADIWCVLNLRAEKRETQRQMISEKVTCPGHINQLGKAASKSVSQPVM